MEIKNYTWLRTPGLSKGEVEALIENKLDEHDPHMQELIDLAITRHNRNASIISMFLGIILLSLFMEGLFRMLGLIPPFLGIDVSILNEIRELL